MVWIFRKNIFWYKFNFEIYPGKSSPPQPAEEVSHTTPLNLSTKNDSPDTPDSPSSLIFDFKKFPIKRECLHSPVKLSDSSSVRPTDPIVLGSVPSLKIKRDLHSPLLSSSSPHSGIWSPMAETDTKRIWSPAVSCEKENNSSGNNNNNLGSKVVVEVRCGGCGDLTGQFRPDTESRCHACSASGGQHQTRQGRTFEVSR